MTGMHLSWLLAWLPWQAGYWPVGVVLPFLMIGWACEAAWDRWRPGTPYLGDWPDDD